MSSMKGLFRQAKRKEKNTTLAYSPFPWAPNLANVNAQSEKGACYHSKQKNKVSCAHVQSKQQLAQITELRLPQGKTLLVLLSLQDTREPSQLPSSRQRERVERFQTKARNTGNILREAGQCSLILLKLDDIVITWSSWL